MIKSYNKTLGECKDVNVALNKCLANASDSIQKEAKNAGEAGIEISNYTTITRGAELATKALNVATNMFLMFVVTKGIELLDYLVHKQEYAMDAVRESHDEFSKSVSDLQAINEEIKTTSQRIEELQKLKDAGTISLADEDELRLLREKNDELDRQRILREQEKVDAAEKGLENLKDADLTVTSKYKYDKNYDPNDMRQQAHGAGQVHETVDIFEEQQLAIDHYNEKLKEKNKLLADGHELTSEEEKKVKEIDAELKSTQDYISDLFNDDAKEKLSYYRKLIEGGIDPDDTLPMSNGLTQKEDYENLVKMEDQLILISYRTRESADAFKLLNEETKRSELVSGLEAKGIKEDLAKKVVDSIRSDELDNYWDLDFKFKLPDINDYDGDIEKWAKDLASLWANSVRDAMESEDISPKLSFEESMSSVQSLSKGLDQLEKVFNDVRNKESFDWSSIFNNEDFKSTFGDFKDEYEDFLKTVSNSPDNIDSCKNAFDSLVTAYINNSKAIRNLNEENKEAAILFLQQKGISNAQEIVSQKLRQNEEKELIAKKLLSKTTKSLTNMTADEIDEFAEENKQLGITSAKIKAFALEKKYANGIGLNTASDISNLKSLVEAIGGVSKALSILERLKSGEKIPGIGGADGYKSIVESARAEIQSALDSVYNPPRIDYNPPSTDKTNSSSRGSGSSKAKDTKSTIDWIQRKLEVLQKTIDLTKEKFNNLFYYTSKRKNLKEQISQVSDLLKAQSNTVSIYEKAAKLAGKKLSKSLREKVDKGDYSIKDYGSKTQELINNYKDLSDKANDARKSVASLKAEIRSLAEQYASMPWEKAQKSIEGHEKYISLWQAQADNAVSSKDKNKYIDKIIEGRRKILKDTQDAVNKDNSNLEYDGNKVKKLLKNKKYNNGKKLSDEQKKAIRDAIKNNKRISLKGIEAGALRKWIEKYNATLKEAKEHTLDLRIATEEFISQMNELNKVKFDNIAHEYENLISLFDSRNSSLQDQISLAEAKGYQVGAAFYKAQIENNRSSLKLLEKERGELLEKMKDLVIGSDEWYDAQQKIHGIDSEITKLTQNNVELNNAIKQLDFSRFEQLQNLLSNIVKESDFLIGLMSNEDMYGDYSNMSTSQLSAINPNGIDFSKYGLAAMGQHSMNYDLYMAMADNYAEEIRKLDAEYANDKNNETYLQKRQEWLEAQQSSITSAQNEKKAIIDLVKGGFDAQINALKKAIEEKKKQLQLDKEAYEFNKKVSEQKKSVADIQKQINALEGDDSEENRKKLQQLKASLKDAEETLKDTMYDKSISDQEKAMDKMLEDSENSVDEYMKDSNKVFAEAINFINSNSKTIGKTIEGVAKDVGYSISHNITDAWKDGGDAVSIYTTKFASAVSGKGGIVAQINLIAEAWKNACKEYDEYAEKTVGETNGKNEQIENTGINQEEAEENRRLALEALKFITNSKNLIKSKHSKKEYKDHYSKLNQAVYEKNNGYVLSVEKEKELGKMLGIDVEKSGWSNRIYDWMKKWGAFSTGGYIDAKSIRQKTGEDGFALVKHGEAILTVEQSKMFSQLVKELPTLTKIPNYINTLRMPNIAQGGNVYNINNSVNVQGVATNEIVKDLESIATKQAENVVTKINRAAYGKGTRK